MVPELVREIGNWIDRFSETLGRWESVLNDLRIAYARGDQAAILELCRQGEEMHVLIAEGKEQRSELLLKASECGYLASSIRELAVQLDSLWPALWTHRILAMEQQLLRIEQLSISVWVSAFQGREYVSDMIRILATGRANEATYSPSESHNQEGGYLVNEAA